MIILFIIAAAMSAWCLLVAYFLIEIWIRRYRINLKKERAEGLHLAK
jgi:hypothetical protein